MITPNSKVALTLGTAVIFAGSLIGFTWRVANTLSDIRQELSAMRRDVSDARRDQWTIRDQERWAFELERTNRNLPLFVPKVPDRIQSTN
jgi:hypothetical protein